MGFRTALESVLLKAAANTALMAIGSTAAAAMGWVAAMRAVDTKVRGGAGTELAAVVAVAREAN